MSPEVAARLAAEKDRKEETRLEESAAPATDGGPMNLVFSEPVEMRLFSFRFDRFEPASNAETVVSEFLDEVYNKLQEWKKPQPKGPDAIGLKVEE